ncbi:hypothetical protein LSCM1_05096 [Leishmania martiniquensis]|uniref:Kinesin motor domain-containing protein n=1 Tax=Leishmania martiniquensis TaxID=1580590 RepID=A0A836H1L4_9TRYP|nr:hypothetical protein LSCM1_05096 [Leishmania martiniquensis]
MKRSTTVLQPAPANAQRLSIVKRVQSPTISSNRHMSLERTASMPTTVGVTTTTAASASPPTPSRCRGGSEGSRNGSHSPKRSDFLSMLTPRTLNAPVRRAAAAVTPPPQLPKLPYDSSSSPRLIPFALNTPFRETLSRRRTQHIPALSRSVPPRSATVAVATAASPSGSPRYASTHDLRQVHRVTPKGFSPARSSAQKLAPSAAALPSVSPLEGNVSDKKAGLEAANGVAPRSTLAAPSTVAAAVGAVAKQQTAADASAEAVARHGRGAPPTLIPTKASQQCLLRAREDTVADIESAAAVADALLREEDLPAATSARSPLFRQESSMATHPLTSGAASRKSSEWSSEHTNRSAALGASDTTLAPSVTSRRPTWLENVDGEDIAVTDEGIMPVSAAASLTYAPTGGSSAALRAIAPVNTTPRADGTAAAPERAAMKCAKKSSETKSASASSAAVTDGGGPGNGQGRCSGVTAAIGAKAERRSLTLRPTSQMKSRDATGGAVPAASSLAPHSPPQTPHRPTTVAVGASPRTPKSSPSRGKKARSAPTQAAASPSGDADGLRGGLPLSGTPATGAPAVPAIAAAAAAASAAPSASLPASEAHGHRAAAILSETLSVVRPMAPVVHVRIRPVLPSIGESCNSRRVYFLDHENVMVTRSRPRTTTANALSTMPPPSLAEAATTRRSATHGQAVPALQLSNLDSRTLRSLGTRNSAATSNGAAETADGGTRDTVPAPSADAPCPAVITAASAPMKAAAPSCYYAGDLALLRSPVAADSSLASKASIAAAGATVTRGAEVGVLHGVSSNGSSASERLLPLSFLPPPPLAVHHNRTISWTSQGSEEHSPSSRLSCGSPSTSAPPQQLGLGLPCGGAGATAAFSTGASAPRSRPWLTTFKPFSEDETPSLFTTPRELRETGTSAGLCATGTSPRVRSGGAAGGKRGTPEPQRRVRGTGLERRPRYHGGSLSAASLTTTQPTKRRSSGATTPAAATLRKVATTSAPSPTSTRRRGSRSILGASVSVSAMSISTMPKASGGATNGMKLAEADADTETEETQQHDRQQHWEQPQFGNNGVSASSAATGAEQHYSFEFVHDEEATQTDVFEESVLRFADEALLAQNVAIICYGPTGSGKTYSMMGNQLQSPSPTLASSGSTSLPASSEKRRRSRGASASNAPSPPQPDSRGHTPHDRASAVETQGRVIDEDTAAATGRSTERDARAVEGDVESDGTGCARPCSGWQYDYAGHTSKGGGGSAPGAARRSHQRYPHSGGSGGPLLTSSTMKLDSAAATGSMTEMGILPRLVHTLLERRGEAITIRRDPEREMTGRNANGLPSTPRPAATPKRAGSLSLTLRDLTFYGIELYMDELCDLLDPGKRPIQAFSDTGGLEVLCQRINKARDYRIRSSRGGASYSATHSARAGGGMPITSLADLRRAYRLAHGNRVTARHAKNDMSSRSHAIFLLQLDFDLIESTGTLCNERDGKAPSATPPLPSERVPRVHSYVAMVDLAGCERVKQTKVEGAALREAQYINKSLSALSSVVLSLLRHSAHVPYRDSKLTRLLRPCLESGRVLTLVHVAPCSSAEAVNTLKFADQIRHIHIPTHALTPTLSRHRELLDVFADLIDPMQGQWEAQVRQAQLQVNRLCADLRLSYFSRSVGAALHRAPSGDSLASDVVSELSALSEVDDLTSVSSADASQEEGPPPLAEDATEAEKRRFALRTLMHRFMKPIQSHQRATMRDAVRAIHRHEEQRVLAHRRQLQERVDELQATLQQLTTLNAKLAKENSTPLPRDPQALELSRRIRESTEELGEYTKEQATLVSLITALRQRLAAQDDLEAAVDEQLHKVQQRTEQAMRTLSAAVAAHPPGGPPAGKGAAMPKEPTLPTESPSATALVMNTKDDPELRDIAHQQLSLAKELAALRLETACFEIGTGLWEGLWARAMRKEIVTAMEVEIFAMERILLDSHALSIMMMPGNADVDGEGARVEDGEADLSSLPLRLQLATYPDHPLGPVKRDECGTGATTLEHPVAAPQIHCSPEPSPPSSGHEPPSCTPSPTRQARQGSCKHGGATPGDGRSECAAAQVSSRKEKGGVAGLPNLLVPQRTRRDRAVDLTATTTSEKSLSSVTEPLSAVSLSSDGPRLRTASGAAGGGGVAAPASSRRRGLHGWMPNPLTVLATNGLQKQLQHPLPSVSSPKASCNNTDGASVLAALLPLSLTGSYEEEQSMQEACLRLLLREGVPCEVCCLGESASHTLQHYILPSSADAPLAEESAQEEPTANSSAVPVRYHVKAVAAASTSGASEKGGDATSSAPVHKSGRTTSRVRLSSAQPCESASGPKVALCTTRHGRLRLARLPRRPNCYVLEFIYTHQALPIAPRLQAALLERPEDVFLSTAGKTHLEQMLDALPSVQGTAGRGGGAGSSGSTAVRPQGPVREHRLFSIPLFEPTLHLHVHVLEEGIPNATTPVAATVGLPSGADAPDIAGASPQGSTHHKESATSLPALCIARRLESGPQLVVEVRGVPQTTSTCRPALSADPKKAPRLSQQQQQKPHSPHQAVARACPTTGPSLHGEKPQRAIGHNPSRPSLSQSGARPSAPPSPSGADAAAWSDVVLAKRLSSGGELMLPSSCILANTGCCSLVLRFPPPFSASPASRVESVEAVIGALCGILRPSLTAPEVRASLSSSPSKRTSSARCRLSGSPRSNSTGGVERAGNGTLGQRRCSVSRSPLQCGRAPHELEVINYVHVPHTMFLASASDTRTNSARAASLGEGAKSLGNGPHTLGRPRASLDTAAFPDSITSPTARSDSLDGQRAMGEGVLGDTLQSSCSPAHRNCSAAAKLPGAFLPQHTASLNGVLKPFRGHSPSAAPAAPLMDQQKGATLQVQFYWIPTPLDLEPPGLGVDRKNSVHRGHGLANDGGGDDGAAKQRGVSSGRRISGISRFSRPSALTAAATAAESAETGVDRLVRLQVLAALSVLAQLSCVFVDGHPLSGVASDTEGTAVSFPGSTLTGSFGAHDARRPSTLERGGRPRRRSETDAARFCDAVAVASLLRQLDTYRHRIRRLFRQQLYDAKDINGDAMVPPAPQSWLTGELGRGAYLREVQEEVKCAVELPVSTVFGSIGGGAAPSLTPPDQHPKNDARGTHAALLEPEGGDASPNVHVTVAEARQACATTVPWTVWQWAYRWSRLRRLLRGPSAHCVGSGDAHGTSRPSLSQAEAAAAWLPVAARNGHGAASPIEASSPLLASGSPTGSPTFATASSSSSDEGFVMESDWLTEAKLAARPTRVWLPEVLNATVPSYLENCAFAGL